MFKAVIYVKVQPVKREERYGWTKWYQLMLVNSGGKKGQVSGSFTITTNTAAQTRPSFGIAIGNSKAYKLDTMYYNDGTGKR